MLLLSDIVVIVGIPTSDNEARPSPEEKTQESRPGGLWGVNGDYGCDDDDDGDDDDHDDDNDDDDDGGLWGVNGDYGCSDDDDDNGDYGCGDEIIAEMFNIIISCFGSHPHLYKILWNHLQGRRRRRQQSRGRNSFLAKPKK